MFPWKPRTRWEVDQACRGFVVDGKFQGFGSGFRVQGSGFMVQGLGFRVSGLRFSVQGLGFRVLAFRVGMFPLKQTVLTRQYSLGVL